MYNDHVTIYMFTTPRFGLELVKYNTGNHLTYSEYVTNVAVSREFDPRGGFGENHLTYKTNVLLKASRVYLFCK